jgi:hypothetical protein
MRKIIGILIILLGLISSCLFFTTGNNLDKNGINMRQNLKSKSGDTVAEFYYQDVGQISSELGGLCYSLGVGIFTISLGLGTIIYNSKKKIIHNESNLNM